MLNECIKHGRDYQHVLWLWFPLLAAGEHRDARFWVGWDFWAVATWLLRLLCFQPWLERQRAPVVQCDVELIRHAVNLLGSFLLVARERKRITGEEAANDSERDSSSVCPIPHLYNLDWELHCCRLQAPGCIQTLLLAWPNGFFYRPFTSCVQVFSFRWGWRESLVVIVTSRGFQQRERYTGVPKSSIVAQICS